MTLTHIEAPADRPEGPSEMSAYIGSQDASQLAADGSRPEPVAVDIVVPVYNEAAGLVASIERLYDYLADDAFPFTFQITIADNASTDDTWRLATELADRLPHVQARHLNQKGRGRALRATWTESTATVLAYMDVDLSTDLAALLPLVAPLLSGHSDIAIGSRLTASSRVTRGAKREVISRCYNLILRTTLRAHFSDAQCGFKAIRADAAARLLPLVQDHGWFFDTELLVLGERAGLRIHEVPVDWVDDPDSRVDIVQTAIADLKGVARLGRALASGKLPLAELGAQLGRGPRPAPVPGVPVTLARQTIRFAAIGVASTLAYVVLYLLLRGSMGAQAANLTALLITAIANTAANRRLTFGVRGGKRTRSQLEGLVVFAIGLGLTSGSLALVHAITSHPHRGVEVSVLIGANLLATIVRFVLLRHWVFHPRRQQAAAAAAASKSTATPALSVDGTGGA